MIAEARCQVVFIDSDQRKPGFLLAETRNQGASQCCMIACGLSGAYRLKMTHSSRVSMVSLIELNRRIEGLLIPMNAQLAHLKVRGVIPHNMRR